jgi:hypothetical protein
MDFAGHIVGIAGLLIFAYSLQMNDKKQLLLLNTIGVALFAVQYALLGAYSGFAINTIAIVRNVVFYLAEKGGKGKKLVSIIFSIIMLTTGLFSWDGYHSLLIIVGVAVNTACMGLLDSQKLRMSMLFSCSLVLVYNICEMAVGGILNEIIAIGSAVVGIVRYISESKKNKCI